MPRWIASVLTALPLALLVAGCPSSVSSVTVELSSDDHESTVNVDRFDNVRVKLTADPNLNLAWTITNVDNDVLEFTGRDDGYFGLRDDGPLDEQHWHFRARRGGTTTLRMAYLNPEDAATVVDTFIVTVVVTE